MPISVVQIPWFISSPPVVSTYHITSTLQRKESGCVMPRFSAYHMAARIHAVLADVHQIE